MPNSQMQLCSEVCSKRVIKMDVVNPLVFAKFYLFISPKAKAANFDRPHDSVSTYNNELFLKFENFLNNCIEKGYNFSL